MRELEAIVKAYDQARKEGLECILATVVHVVGSSYRKAGARMLVDEEGMMTGAISGGCLEGNALKKALHALHQMKNKLVTYDTSDENDAVIGAQLGCNGVIQVLFEPIDESSENHPIELLRKVINSDIPLVIVTYFHLDKTQNQPGTMMLCNEQLILMGHQPEAATVKQLKLDIQQCFAQQQGHYCEYIFEDQSQHVFLEFQKPPIQLVIVGAGNDAQVLAEMAEKLGWKISVVDGRHTHAHPNRFTGSCQVMVTKPENMLDKININDQTYFVLMSHNYQYDLAVLQLLIDQPVIPYIGLLGPRSKFERMQHETNMSEHQQIYTPVGLNIGADTPAEIALAILAEIQAVKTQAQVLPLREKQGPIHDKKQPEFKKVRL